MLLLDRAVKPTGYAREDVIRLLNRAPESATCILRPRLRIYGPAVQAALFS
jgi:hypothetical protein